MPDTTAYDPLGPAGTWHRLRAKLIVYALLVLFALYYVVPLTIVILNSFRSLPDFSRNGLISLPHSFSLEYWSSAWSKFCVGGSCEGIQPFFFNSVAMAIPATIISTAMGSLNGYVLSKWRFTGSETLFGFMTLGVFMPGQMVLLPWARVLGWLGLSNTIAGLVLIHCVQGLSFTTLFCRNYYVNIPDDLVKAARIDGAGFWRIFRTIVLPLSPPILIVTAIWQFTNIWNEFLFAVIFSSGTNQPITAALIALGSVGMAVHNYGVESAAVLIAALPPLLVYLFGGRYFLRGLTQGALK